MSTPLPWDRNAFLARFYGEGNDIKLDHLKQVDGRELRSAAREWLDELPAGAPDLHPRSALLLHKGSGGFTWYGVASDPADLRELGEQLGAFVGPSYSQFRGAADTMDPTQPVEAAIRDYLLPRAFRVPCPAREGAAVAVAKALRMLLQVRKGRGRSERPPEWATARVLREFKMALAAGDRHAAERALAYLRAHQRLDAINLTFLDVQLRAELGFWNEVTSLELFPRLLQVRRPVAVTRAMIQAVYRKELAVFEATQDIAGACEHFKKCVFVQYQPLFSSRYGLSEPEVIKAFMFLAVTRSPGRTDLRDELLSLTDLPPHDRAYLKRLAATLQPTTCETDPANPLDAAAKFLRDGDLDGAVAHLRPLPVSLAGVRMLLEVAYDTRSTEHVRLALEATSSLPAAQQEQLLGIPSAAHFLEKLTHTPIRSVPLDDSVPGDWAAWLARLGDTEWNGSLEIAETGAEEWPVQALAESPASIDGMVELLHRANEAPLARKRLQEALPHLLRFFQADREYPRSSFSSLYAQLRSFLVITFPTVASAEFQLFGELAEAALSLGVGAEEYDQLLAEMEMLWDCGASAFTLGSALDFLDALFRHNCPSCAARQNLVICVINSSLEWIRFGRVSPEQWRFLVSLANEAQVGSILDALEYGSSAPDSRRLPLVDPLLLLSGTIAIHTLMEGAAIRVREELARRNPNCRVELNFERDASAVLRDLARSADVFVVVTNCAKHAATMAIQEVRHPSKPVLRPTGKGASSILQALSSYASGLLKSLPGESADQRLPEQPD